VAALFCAAGLLVPVVASACPCSEFCGPVVAHGKSLYRIPWRIRAIPEGTKEEPQASIGFSIGRCGEYSDAGYFVGFPLPVPSAFVFSADTGVGVDAFPEGDLSGITKRRVTKLVVAMSEGEPLTIHPELAPRRLWKRLGWLRGLRFYDQFFQAGPVPREVTAFDRSGHVLAHRASSHGRFFAVS
jgi:hypothetical protein